MDSPLEKVTVSLLADDISSRSSSFIFSRIVRKPDDRSSSKRSNSRKSLESTTELSKFYVKMGSGRESQPKVEERRESKLMEGDRSKQVKKRNPTPMLGKGKVQLKNSPSPKKEILRQMQLASLEKRIEDQRVRKLAAERRADVFEKEVKQKLKRINQLETMVESFKGNDQNVIPSLGADQRRSKQKGISGIQRMRKNMAQFRIQELQKENAELLKENAELKQQVQKFRIDQQMQKDECQALRNQIVILSERTGSAAILESKQREIECLRQKINMCASEREKYLDGLLTSYEADNQKLKDKIFQLQCKIAFINRKKNEELEQVVSKKDKDILSIRKKLSLVVKQSLEIKKEVQKNRMRQNMLTRSHDRGQKMESASLELSP